LLEQTASIESESPLSGAQVRLAVGPQGMQALDPAGTVVSFVVADPDVAARVPSRRFCNHTFFFASRQGT